MLLGILYFILAVVSLLLIILILMQDSKAGGLTAAFTGSETIVGAGAGKEITKVTGYLVAVFLVLCVFTSWYAHSEQRDLGLSGPGLDPQKQIESGDKDPAGDGPPPGVGTTPPGDGTTPPGDGTTPPGDGTSETPGDTPEDDPKDTQPEQPGTPPADKAGETKPAGDGGQA